MYDSIGTMMLNIGMYGAGLAFAVIGMIIGATRGITKEKELWAIGFSMFAWLIAMMIPSVTWAIIIYLMGAIGIVFSFLPILMKTGDANIFAIAGVSIIVSLLLSFGAGAFSFSMSWQTNLDSARTDIANLLGTEYTALDNQIPESGMCREGDPSCTPTVLQGVWDSVIFDVFASVLAMPVFISKAIALATFVVYAPFSIRDKILPLIANPIAYYLIAMTMLIWNMAVLYKIIAFVLAKRGMK